MNDPTTDNATRIKSLQAAAQEALACPKNASGHTWRGPGFLSTEVRCTHCQAPRQQAANAEDVLFLAERIAELEAGVAWRDEERDHWADARSFIERAIDKGCTSIDTDDLADLLGPNGDGS